LLSIPDLSAFLVYSSGVSRDLLSFPTRRSSDLKEGVGEVAWPIITSTLTTLAAFLPLAFWDDIIGEFMKFLPITLIIVLSSSLFVALVINPVLASIFMKVEKGNEDKPRKRLLVLAIILSTMAIIMYLMEATVFANILMLGAVLTVFNVFVLRKAIPWFQNVFLVRLEHRYERTLTYVLGGRRPFYFLLGSFGLLFFSMVLLGIRAPEVLFFPDNQPALVNVYVEHPIGTDIEATNSFMLEMEDDLLALLEPNQEIVEAFITQIGEGAGDPMEFSMG